MKKQLKILIIEDDQRRSNNYKEAINKQMACPEVEIFSSHKDIPGGIDYNQYDLIITDNNTSSRGGDGLRFIQENAKQIRPPIILISGKKEPTLIVNAIKGGCSKLSMDPFI